MQKILVSLIAITFLLSACGGGGGVQNDVADVFIELAGDEGLALDDDCVRSATARLTDDDAQAIIDAGVDGDPEVSDAADAIGEEIFSSCVDADSYIALVVATIADDDETVDADCMTEALSGLSVDEVDDRLFDVAFSCSSE